MVYNLSVSRIVSLGVLCQNQKMSLKLITEVAVCSAGRAGNGIFAKNNFKAGEILCESVGPILTEPNRHTVQYDSKTHIFVEPPLVFTNHSCVPNALVQFSGFKVQLKAIKDIKTEEEIFFNYNSSEIDMAEAFDCNCKGEECPGRIQGFKHLNWTRKNALLPLLTPHVKDFYKTTFLESSLLYALFPEGNCPPSRRYVGHYFSY